MAPFLAGGVRAAGPIDLHAHWTPGVVAHALRQREGIPRIRDSGGQETYHSIYGQRPFGLLETDLAERLAFMDAHGIAVQVLSLPGLFGIDSLPVAESMPLVATFNDEAARACRTHHGRFLALAALPHVDIALACQELRRAHGMGLRGAILPADGFATRENARRFEPLLALAASLGSHLFIHPGPVATPPPAARAPGADTAWLRHIVLHTQARLSEVMVTLNLTDLLDPWPELTVQVANLGGGLPFFAERIAEVGRMQLGDSRAVEPRLRRAYVDTASFGPRAIAMAVACFGAERVVFGSDCPIFDSERMNASLDAADITTEERHAIARGNAERLFDLGDTQRASKNDNDIPEETTP